MNQALNLKNWTDGGNNYILKASSNNKWSGFQNSVIEKLITLFDDKFNIVIWTDEKNENDYYCIPFVALKHLFVDEHKTTGKFPNRWTAVILNHRFLMHGNSELSVDISSYYSLPLSKEFVVELDNDFYIENAKAEINIRLRQSKFRKGVLKNFDYKCAVTGISEKSLLTASHIVPWSHNKKYRADISNGICLYTEIDALFDKGFISFTDDLKVIITSDKSKLSEQLIAKLDKLNGKYLTSPTKKELKKEYLSYHRANIFKQ